MHRVIFFIFIPISFLLHAAEKNITALDSLFKKSVSPGSAVWGSVVLKRIRIKPISELAQIQFKPIQTAMFTVSTAKFQYEDIGDCKKCGEKTECAHKYLGKLAAYAIYLAQGKQHIKL